MSLETTLYNWMFLGAKGVSLEGFFSANRIRRVAIYGCGKLGELMYPDMKKYGVDVKFVVDRSKDWFYDLPVVRPERLADMSGTVDCIVVCISCLSSAGGNNMNLEFEIGNFLDNFKTPSIYVDEIITACFYKEILLPLCERKSLQSYILGRPICNSLRGLDSAEKLIAALMYDPAVEKSNPPYFGELYADIPEYGAAYIESVCAVPASMPYKGAVTLPDMRTPYVNIAGGMRLNPFAPDDFLKTIYILGHCTAYGLGVDDTRTIAARLQSKLNTENASAGIRVLNCGQVGMDTNSPMLILNAIEDLNCKENDILITLLDVTMGSHRTYGVIERMLNKERRIYHCLREYFNAKRRKPAYMTATHLSPHGMELTADFIYQILFDGSMLSDEVEYERLK
jgi:hypothetical protein